MTKQTTTIAAAVLLLAAVGTMVYVISGKSPTVTSNTVATSGSSRTSSVSNGHLAPGSSLEDASGATRTKRGTRSEREEPTSLRFKPDTVAAMMKNSLAGFNFTVTLDSALPTLNPYLDAERDKKLTEALLTMGANDSEAAEVLSILKQTQTDLLAAEKQKVQVIHTDSIGVTLDLSGMKDAVNEATAKAKESLRGAVPSDLSGPLVSAIDWDGFYFGNNASNEANFKVIRSARGGLQADFSSSNPGGRFGIPDRFKDDGTPIPADQLFGERWAPFLKGVKLLPVNEQ